MLGELILPQERGKITGIRVLAGADGGPNRMESTFQSAGRILDVAFTNTGTILGTATAQGVVASEGCGVGITEDGGLINWTFSGIGRPTGANGAMAVRGQVLFKSVPANLSQLAGICGAVEAEFDAEQNMTARMWAWV